MQLGVDLWSIVCVCVVYERGRASKRDQGMLVGHKANFNTFSFVTTLQNISSIHSCC